MNAYQFKDVLFRFNFLRYRLVVCKWGYDISNGCFGKNRRWPWIKIKKEPTTKMATISIPCDGTGYLEDGK